MKAAASNHLANRHRHTSPLYGLGGIFQWNCTEAVHSFSAGKAAGARSQYPRSVPYLECKTTMLRMPRTATAMLITIALLGACDSGSQEAAKPAAAETVKETPPPAKPAITAAMLPGGPVTGDGTELGSGILAWTITDGTGGMLPVEPSTATMNISAWSMNGTQYFGGPDGPDELVLPTGDSAAFDGWSTAVSDMKIGETRKVWISAADRAAWPLRDADPQDLVMEIELVSFGDEAVMPALIPGTPVGDAVRNGSSSGLRWYDMASGTGAPLAHGDTATIRCDGWLPDGSPWQATGTMPVAVTIDEALMPAIAEGLIGMKPGSTRKLIIPPTLGAGFDPLGALPPGTMLILDVEYVKPATASADGG